MKANIVIVLLVIIILVQAAELWKPRNDLSQLSDRLTIVERDVEFHTQGIIANAESVKSLGRSLNTLTLLEETRGTTR